MALFKKTKPVVEAEAPLEILDEKINALTTELHDFKESAQKQIDEIYSALSVLDEDLLDLKAIKRKQTASPELDEIKQTLDSLKVMGRLCIQNKEEIEVLEESVRALQKTKKQDTSPVKILN